MQYTATFTDYYQLTMGYAHWQANSHEQEAVFHLFFRRHPVFADYVLTSGLQNVIDFIKHFQFSDEDLHFLSENYGNVFSADFLTYLKTLRFTGDIDAMPEGSIAFANEPILRVRAPLILCQLLETPLINFINFSSAVSTLASRMRSLVPDALLFEFGLRRAQGPDGGITASRAAYIGGFDASSNIVAAKAFKIPLVGTMSHSWVMSFEDELSAFYAYARLMPDNVVLLVDTYHTMQGIKNAITVGKSLKKSGQILKGVRLDSGDFATLSKEARRRLDEAELFETKVFVSGDLSFEKIESLKALNVPIDGYGVGTYLSTSYQQPALDMVFKLGAIKKNNKWCYKLKLSDNESKMSDPGILQVKRFYEGDTWLRDIIYNTEEMLVAETNKAYPDKKNLLQPLFRDGKHIAEADSIAGIRMRAAREVKHFLASKTEVGYRVLRDPALQALKDNLIAEARYGKK